MRFSRFTRRAWNRFRGVFAAARGEAELASEIESHLAMQADDYVRQGMSPDEARRRAAILFGGAEGVKETYRDQRGLPALETLLRDIRYAVRTMRKNPGFTATAVLSLALGIAASTAMFTVVNSLLLRTLPYRDPNRLAAVSMGGAITAPMFEKLRREARSIESAALFQSWTFNLAAGGEPERVPAARVSSSLFHVLGIWPRIGRAFTAGEDRPGNDRVVLVGDALWKNRFAADPHIVGRTVLLSGAPYTIIGVMPPGFQFPDGPELPETTGAFPPAGMWRPMAMGESERTCDGCYNFAMIARLRGGVEPDRAQAELNRIAEKTLGRKAASGEPLVTVRALKDVVTSQVRRPVVVLFAAVGVALLIACVNVAGLLLARGLSRRAEIALRLSLGAARGRIVRQMLTEALVLSVCAGLLAIPLAFAGVRGILSIAPPDVFGLDTIHLDARVLAFAFVLSLMTVLIAGVIPAIETARHAPGDVLKDQGRTATAAPSRIRKLLVTAEFALALLLFVAATLLARSFAEVARTPLGFHPENVLTMRVSLPDALYNEKRRAVLIPQLVADCATIPGVTSAAAISTLPLTGGHAGWGMNAPDDPGRNVMMRARLITPGYFRTAGIRLLDGREFTANDGGKAPAAILSKLAAQQLWPGVVNPIGRKLGNRKTTVVGIVDDTRASGLDAEILPYIYVPFEFPDEDFALVVRAAANPTGLASAVKSQVWRIAKDQPITNVELMTQLVADSIAPRRFEAVLMGLFAAFSLGLAALGIYGVISYSVAQRTHEIGIRMALGASRFDVVLETVKEAGILALAGAAAGLSAALFVMPLLRSLLYGISATEPALYAISLAALVGAALIASVVPAKRAAGLDPMACLRHE